MAMTGGFASVEKRDPFGRRPNASPITAPKTVSNVYDTAVTQQAGDYDRIMKSYEDLANANKAPASQLPFTPLSPKFTSYMQGPGYQTSDAMSNLMGNLEEFSQTGGYSSADQSNIRERGISPVRSVYANAMRNLQRQKALSGGYSPNMGAALAKMARESSSQIGDISTNVNAKLAEMIAAGKQQAMSTLSPLAARENEMIYGAGQKETDEARRVNEANAAEARRVEAENARLMMETEQINQMLRDASTRNQVQGIQGQASLYGTTPALVNTFGQQALQQGNLDLNAAQTGINRDYGRGTTGLNLIRSVSQDPRYRRPVLG